LSGSFNTLDGSQNTSGISLLGAQGGYNDLIASKTANSTLQGFAGSAATNTTSDTLTGGGGADLFVMANGGDTQNAYGNGNGGLNVALITGFVAGSGNDVIQLHDFGGVHGGSAGYQTVSGGAGIIDIYTYNSQTAADHVAHLTGVTGTFTWNNNAHII